MCSCPAVGSSQAMAQAMHAERLKNQNPARNPNPTAPGASTPVQHAATPAGTGALINKTA